MPKWYCIIVGYIKILIVYAVITQKLKNLSVQKIPLKNKLDQSKIDAMKFGMFNNISYWGKKSSVLKSGVCKYFRRGEVEKYEWCVIEMMIFGLKNKGLMTNIIN